MAVTRYGTVRSPNRKGSWEGMRIRIITHGPEGERCARGEKKGGLMHKMSKVPCMSGDAKWAQARGLWWC